MKACFVFLMKPPRKSNLRTSMSTKYDGVSYDTYEGSAPRAADTARYPRARKVQHNVKGAKRRGPSFGATSNLRMPRATCAELVALRCATCLLAMSRSDRHSTDVVRNKTEEDRERTVSEKSNKTSTQRQYTRTYRYII